MTTSVLAPELAGNPLQDRIALVTGSGRRIGRAIAIALAEEGVHVVAHDRRALEQETEQVCGEVVRCGARSWKVIADLEKPAEYENLITQASRMAGKLDILVNNASVFTPGTVSDATFSDLVRHLEVNAWAPLVLMREFAKQSVTGKIVNLLDTKITGRDTAHFTYILSKKMLAALTRICALEFAPRIAVNGIAPGLILPPAGRDEGYLDELARALPLRRHGTADDVTDALLYLVRSEFVTGQVLYVDGGRHLLEDQTWTES